MTDIEIGTKGPWQVMLIDSKKPYPLLLKEGRRVDILFNTTDIPRDVQNTFWHLIEEHNIFLEGEELEDDDQDQT